MMHRRQSRIALGVLAVLISIAIGFGGGRWFGHAPPANVGDPTVAAAAPGHAALDRAHETRVKAFPAKTAGLGGQPIPPRILGGIKVFELTARQLEWEVESGVKRTAFAYNGQVPGPTIRVNEGDRVRVVIKNELPESTTIHFHGVMTPNSMDGVPYISQPPIKPGLHLHGLPGQVIAKDGRRLTSPYMADTVNVAPGERYDVLVTASEPGVWALHCHILSHAESPQGMHGMVTAVIVQK